MALPIAVAALMGATSSAAADETFSIIRPFGSIDNARGGPQWSSGSRQPITSHHVIPGEEASGPKWKGYSQGELSAYTYASPDHWSKPQGKA